MLGFGDKHQHIDPTTLPIFVHALQNSEAFGLARKIWENNARYVMFDAGNNKDLLRFVFNDPACVVWLERDKGRTDTFELVMLWDATDKKENVSEVYVLSEQAAATIGDDARVKSLLSAILSSPAIVPVSNNPNSQSGPGQAPAAA
jgi:hypothetical protein